MGSAKQRRRPDVPDHEGGPKLRGASLTSSRFEGGSARKGKKRWLRLRSLSLWCFVLRGVPTAAEVRLIIRQDLRSPRSA